jgi:AcrR family transcriptional regulator
VDPAATRERILEAAARAFAKGGFHGTSLKEVAAAAGMRAPSLLHHFPSKEALFDAVIRRAYARIEEPLAQVLSSGAAPREMLGGVLETLAAFEADHRELLDVLNAEILGPGRHGIAAVRDTMLPLVERVEAAVRAASHRGLPADAPIRPALLHVLAAHAVRANLGELAPELLGSEAQERALATALLEAALTWRGRR